jgi:tetratricopeptide (TPR) repeat protein
VKVYPGRVSLLRRWLQPSYRRALAAEAAGDLEEAARLYALAGQRDRVADMHLRIGERAPDEAARIAALRNALDWLDHEADVRVVEVALANAILLRARVDGVSGTPSGGVLHPARDIELLEEAAALFEEAEEWARAADAHELLGHREDAARCYEKGGIVDKLEALLSSEQEKESDTRGAKLLFQEYEMELIAGGRDKALVALRRAAATAASGEGYGEVLRRFERRFPRPGRVVVRVDGRELQLVGRLPAVLGRAEADVALRHAGISRAHARVGREGGRFWIEDAGSRNGTFLDGLRVGGRIPLPGKGLIGLGDSCAVGFEVREETLELEVAEGLDRGRKFALVDGRLPLAGSPSALVFDPRGVARLVSSAPVMLNGNRTAEQIVLIEADVIEAGAVRIEVPSWASGSA